MRQVPQFEIELQRATMEDAEKIWEMQRESFLRLLEIYEDYETNPANESIDRVAARLSQAFTFYYFIIHGGEKVGAIRVIDKKDGSAKRISPLFILPKFQGRGFAQSAIKAVEKIHGSHGWNLDTIQSEQGNCYLYEKMGYKATGKTEKINERLTLVFYAKD